MTKKKYREEWEYALAADLKNRSSMILKHMSEKSMQALTRWNMKCPPSSTLYFSATMETAVTVHKNQQEPSHGGDNGNWFVRSRSLRENGITALHPSETDIQKLWEILLPVLGDEGIEQTWQKATQAKEAANRALDSRCPKHVKFSRPVTARVGSAILTRITAQGILKER